MSDSPAATHLDSQATTSRRADHARTFRSAWARRFAMRVVPHRSATETLFKCRTPRGDVRPRLSATLRFFPASTANIMCMASINGPLPMFSRRLTRSIAVVAAVLVVGGSAYGIVNANSSSSSGTASAATPTPAQVIPFTPGQPGATQVEGQVPPDYVQGSGTIVTGPAADAATAAAVAAYPGGTVNRVVLLSSGDYEVHMIAVNWPHHVFVNQDFNVIGAA